MAGESVVVRSIVELGRAAQIRADTRAYVTSAAHRGLSDPDEEAGVAFDHEHPAC
jgi:hypothetical protein